MNPTGEDLSAACEDGEHGVCDGVIGFWPGLTAFQQRQVCQCDCHWRPGVAA